MRYLSTLLLLAISAASVGQTSAELVGFPRNATPNFTYHQSFNWNYDVFVGVDPFAFELADEADIYITENHTELEWQVETELYDVRSSGPQTNSLAGFHIGDVNFLLEGTPELENYEGARPGKGYDVVLDMNQNGVLDAPDLVDGLGDEAGFYLVGNMLEPGPYEVDTAFHSSSFWHTMRVYYPSNISELDSQPLVVISHGWTHEYWYYDYIGYHLASYGYVVMSHRNEVGNGGAFATETASQTALENIDEFFLYQNEIADGLLAGKINSNQIIHTGHSTGGECVVRAYKRLFDGDYQSPNFTHEDIVLVSSLAPVAFLDASETNPEGVNYHQFLAAADTDAAGTPTDSYQQPLSIYERGYGNKQITYIHGAGHEDLNDEPGNPLASGPDLIGKEATHTVVKPYFLALCELYSRNNLAVKEYFTRKRQDFRPEGISPDITVTGEYTDAQELVTVIDDFQSAPETDLSSSGGAVTTSLENYYEVLMQDLDESFDWTGNQWSNGMTRARFDDNPKCATLSWEEDDSLTFEIPSAISDWTAHSYLHFRACQLTRHPLNSDFAELSFDVQIEDAMGQTGLVSTSNYGLILQPYQRGNGGYLQLCLEPGTYIIEVGGSNWPEEMLFTIPGYFDEQQTAGTYELVIESEEPCVEIEVFMYDTWGDGWDAGTLEILDGEGVLIAEGTLGGGSLPDINPGWQNEFHVFHINLTEFLLTGTDVDLSQIVSAKFLFGETHGSPAGAIGLDDLSLAGSGLSFQVAVAEERMSSPQLSVYPNPAVELCIIQLKDYHLTSISVMELTGKIVMQETINGSSNIQLDVSDWASGLYIVQVTYDGGKLITRLVVG
jgi:hypothetical protein